MRDVNPGEELHRAEQVLVRAYTRARRIGYQPGSDEMLILRLAEQSHQQARGQDLRRRDDRLRPDAETPTRTS